MKKFKRKKIVICLLLTVIIGIAVITFLVSRGNKKQTKEQKHPSPDTNNITEQRQNFLKNELEKLPQWEKLSTEEQNELKNDCQVSQPQKFPEILEKAKKLIAKKNSGGGEEPNPEPGQNPSEDNGNNPNPEPTNGQNNNEVNKPTNDWAAKVDFAAIQPTQKEKEYSGGSILPISSVGTEYRDCYKLAKMLPRGSALLTGTGTGELKNGGIESIIHAAPGSTAKKHENEYHPVIKGILRATQNSIILAEREGYDKIAIPFIRGDFWDMFDDIEATAKAIVYGALNQRKKLTKIIFVLAPDKKRDRLGTEFKFIDYFQKCLNKYQQEYPNQAKFGKVIEGDITNFTVHGAKVIVNDANMEMEWTSGISESIRQKINNYQEIQNKAQELINKFNSSPSSSPPTNNNQPKLEIFVQLNNHFLPKNCPDNVGWYNNFCSIFFLTTSSDPDATRPSDWDDNKYWYFIHHKHSCLKGKKVNNECTCKLTILEKDKEKRVFEVGDFIELEITDSH